MNSNLLKVMQENPTAPVFINKYTAEGYVDDYTLFQLDETNVEVKELTYYKDKWLDREAYRKQLAEDLQWDEEYLDILPLTEEELEHGFSQEQIDKYVKKFERVATWTKAIIVEEFI